MSVDPRNEIYDGTSLPEQPLAAPAPVALDANTKAAIESAERRIQRLTGNYVLKPCPFCGGDAELIRGEEAAAAQCLQVKAHRLVMTGDNNIADEVAEQWNRRPLLKSVEAFAAVFDDVSPRICDLDPEDRQRLWSAYAELESLTIVGGGA